MLNRLGERAGNASLEEIVMALKTRRDCYGLETGLDTTKLHSVSSLVSRLSGVVVPPNKAIVGANKWFLRIFFRALSKAVSSK